MTATLTPALDDVLVPAGAHDPLRHGPYRVVFERLERLVRYRADQLARLEGDPGNQKAASELVRIRHLIREAHRAVSINLAAKELAQRIDPGERPPPAARFGL